MHSPDHSTKGTPSALAPLQRGEWPLTAWKHTVSGSLSSPLRGAFHLSLTVLVHYRSLLLFSLGGWSPQLPTSLLVARGTQVPARQHSPWATGLSPAAVARSRAFASRCAVVSAGPTTPPLLAKERFGLLPVRSPLLRESRLISLRRATEMFQFAHFPPDSLCIQEPVSRHHSGWVAPLGLLGFIARQPLPPNVSPLAASVFGQQRPGIPRVLISACEQAGDEDGRHQRCVRVCFDLVSGRCRYVCSMLAVWCSRRSPTPMSGDRILCPHRLALRRAARHGPSAKLNRSALRLERYLQGIAPGWPPWARPRRLESGKQSGSPARFMLRYPFDLEG
jgi:hypothetical protein